MIQQQDISIPASALNATTRKGILSSLARNAKALPPPEGSAERESWWRAVGTALTMVKHTSNMMEQAQATIKVQEERIKALEAQVMTDEMTGLLNRRGFATAFAAEIDRTNRGHSVGGLLVVIDLDNFKMINDTYGHQAGDTALRLVGRTLLNDSRMMDSCARLGGDEFVLLLANTDRDRALVRAQNLIKRLNSLSLVWYGAEIPVRASLGLKEYAPGDHPDDIFGQADDKLYESKRSNKGSLEMARASQF